MTTLSSPFGAIKLTELGAKKASSAAQNLKGRERQFLLLLQRDDPISQQICEAMLPKVDLQVLLTHRLIWVENESLLQVPSQNTAESAHTVTALSAEQEVGDIDPILQLAAGIV